MTEALDGGCACGKVRYRMEGDPLVTNCCHCRDCQRESGSAFAVNAMIEADRVTLTGDVDPEAVPGLDVMADMIRCPDCGTVLWAYHRMFGPKVRFLRVGTLDQGERIVPDAHFFVRSKHPWVSVPDGVPAYETLPDDPGGALFDAAARERLATLGGS